MEALTIAEAKAIQQLLAKRVRLDDDFPETLSTVCGLDCSYSRRGKDGRMIAGAVLLRFGSWERLESAFVEGETPFPYVPGLLSFRELPLLLEVLRRLERKADLYFVDGAGIAHPRRLGLASHLGVVADIPTIGVAKSRLCGSFDEPASSRGAESPLRDHDETIGTVLRTREAVKPLFVSPGQRVSLESASRLVLACCGRYRLPEPTRQAHRLVTERRAMWKEKGHDATY